MEINKEKKMAIIASIKQSDAWEGRFPPVTKARFIPEHVIDFPGSACRGGLPSSDPVADAKKWAEANGADSDIHGFYLEVIDTQSPVGTSTHKTLYYPESTEENNFVVEWVN